MTKYLLCRKGSETSTGNSQPEQRALPHAPRTLYRGLLVPSIDAVDHDVDEEIN
ncbi:hypothetical protein QO002_005463 [Pararhizobium capsulatum DSM 1112]|uniref:Transposase n=1 Tax=Pararhizobium capsulatum DSM 1112 TaxID=1121113 RepID=A0ABU0C2B7_9HYPH|nr:hypothetical protein [Pararhizobium capsulatum DSM 1112]